MRHALRWSMAAVLVAGVTALAQQGRPGFGFGGGFGGGLTALVNSKMVKEEIKLTDDQSEKVKEVGKKMREVMAEKMKDIPRDQFREKGREVMAEVTKETEKELGGILKPEQLKRLKQIDLQVSGTLAYSRPDVQEALKLTDEQKEKLKGIGEESRKSQQDLREEYGIKGFGGGGGGQKLDADKQKEFNKKQEAITAETTSKVTALLTDEQKKEWANLTGEKFDVAKYREEMRAAFGQGGGNRPRRNQNKDNE